MDSITLFNTITSVVALMGFILTAAVEYRRHRRSEVSIYVTSARVYSTSSKNGINCAIFAIIANGSSELIGITGIDLCARNKRYSLDPESDIIVGKSTDTRHDLMSTGLPINLPPYAAQQVRLHFHVPKTALKPLRLRGVARLPLSEDTIRSARNDTSSKSDMWPFRLRVQTPRRDIYIADSAKVYSYVALADQVWHESNRVPPI